MMKAVFFGPMLLMLAACQQQQDKAATPDDSSGPQIATSIDDYSLPVDRSDQVTAIDAATGDAGGMPRDGGNVVTMPKPEVAESIEPAIAEQPVATPTVLPAPPTPALPPPAPVPVPAPADGQ